MNRTDLLGRLTADPELQTTQNGISFTRFTIAVRRRFTKEGQQQADFISCVAWRQTAEFLCKYFHKGNMIAVVGSIQSRSWDDSDGKKHYAMEILTDYVDFTGEKVNIPLPPSSQQPDFDGLGDMYEYNDEEAPF